MWFDRSASSQHLKYAVLKSFIKALPERLSSPLALSIEDLGRRLETRIFRSQSDKIILSFSNTFPITPSLLTGCRPVINLLFGYECRVKSVL
jgi:hypothetical protein